jgi:uncharacterized repeat protein (TIGR01451 family)
VLLAPVTAWPQQGSIELKSTTEREVVTKDAQGKEIVKRIEAAKANVTPGDVVIVTTTYRNTGKAPVDNMTILNPVPRHTTYVDLSASGKDTRIEFSIDGGKTYALPEKLTVTDAQGKKRPAMPTDYTDIRWTLLRQLKPGGSGTVSFRTRIK